MKRICCLASWHRGLVILTLLGLSVVLFRAAPSRIRRTIRLNLGLIELNRAVLCGDSESEDSARETLESLSKGESANTPSVAYGLGLLYLARGDGVSSTRWFSQIHEDDPRAGMAQFQLGLNAYRDGDLSTALASWRSAGAVGSLLSLADELRLRGDWLLALDAYDAVIALDSRNVVALYYAGDILLDQKEWARAIPYFQRAAALSSTGWPHIRLGDIYEQQGDYDAALRMYEQAGQVAPNNEWPHIRMGRLVFLYFHDDRRAINFLNRALSLNPDNAVGHYWLGRAAFDAGESDLALQEIRLALSFDPSIPTYHFRLYAEAGDLWITISDLLLTRGATSEAASFLCQVVRFLPGSRAARQAQARLAGLGMSNTCNHGEGD